MIITSVTLVLFGWAMSTMYYAQADFAEIIKNPKPPWVIEINMVPIIAAILIGSILTVVTYMKGKQKFKSARKAMFLPAEFEESDEREQMLTAKACRASYISMWYTFPILTGLLLIYPFIIETVPYYPIIIVLLYPFTQSLAYFISWKKNY